MGYDHILLWRLAQDFVIKGGALIILLLLLFLQEPNTFFVLTNLWQTCNQTQDRCPEVSWQLKMSYTETDCQGDRLPECPAANCAVLGWHSRICRAS